MSDGETDGLIARKVAHAAIEVDATDAQRDEIAAIVTEIAGGPRAVPEGFREAGGRMEALLVAEEVDAAALEAVRAERLAEADRMGCKVVSAMVQVVGLATSERRRTVAERLETFREVHERRRRD